jgi:hypothetical protein
LAVRRLRLLEVSAAATFFVNGRMLVGAQQLAAFETLMTD